MEARTRSVEETYAVAKKFIDELRSLPAKEAAAVQGATLVLLHGDLGAGKTTFVQGIIRALGVKETVTSPTFVLMKKYALRDGERWRTLIHIDAYRLEGTHELEGLRFEEVQSDPESIIFFEWPERIWKTFPKDSHTIRFRFVDETTREISW